MYNLEEKKLIREISKRKAKKVLLQFPDGLKKEALDLVNLLRENNVEVIVSGENCYGGCDLALMEAKELNVDLIVHYGHRKMVESEIPVVYFLAKSKIKLDRKKILEKLEKYKKICIVASIQYIDQLEDLKKMLKGKKIIIPGREGYLEGGQVIGCNYERLKKLNVDCFFVLGSRFHGLGAALSLDKRVVNVNDCGVEDLSKERERVIKKRVLLLEKIKDKKNFGIILSLKPGQKNFKLAKCLEKEFLKKKNSVILISMNELSNEKLLNFYNIDVFVNTGCIRLIEDKFEKPLISVKEARVLLGKKSYEEFIKQGLF